MVWERYPKFLRALLQHGGGLIDSVGNQTELSLNNLQPNTP
jgi:hypothetical protein